ncbi:MAG: hypothetical protein ACREMA_08870 [Longimicrobiales bacterium]
MSGADSGQSTRAPWRSWLPRVLVESLLIVFSVLLALGLDQWRDQRARVRRANLALEAIRAEIVENLGTLQRVRSHHLAMRDSLLSYAARRQAPPEQIYLGGIFNPGLTHATAWESARETGVTGDLPYRLVLELSQVYDWQARYRSLGDALAQDLMAQVRREGRETVMRDRAARFIDLQEDFANREASLIKKYEHILPALHNR